MCCSKDDDGCVPLRMKILLCLRSEPVMTALAGVVLLHGGITEECHHLPRPLKVVPPGENPDRVVRSAVAASMTSFSFLKASLLEARTWERMGSGLVLLWCCCCSGLSFQGAMYAVAGGSKASPFSGLAKSCYPPADS
jgi:hypothetical protein